MAIDKKNKKIPDIRVIFLLGVFIGIPIIVFISWIVANNEFGNIVKMIIVFISAVLVTLIYRVIRYFFTVRSDKGKMSFFKYILVQSVSLIITLIVIWFIVAWLKVI